MSEKWNQEENMVRTMVAKDQFPYIKMNLYQRGLKRSIHDKISIVSMGMNARFKVDSHFANT